MKLAILICGEFRTFDLGYKTFGIFDKLNPDYYFSTWEKSSEIYEDKGINHVIDVTEDTIKELKKENKQNDTLINENILFN